MATAVGTLRVMVSVSSRGFVRGMGVIGKTIRKTDSLTKKLGHSIKKMAKGSLWPLKILTRAFNKLWVSVRGVLRIMGGPLGRIGWFGGLGAAGGGVLGISFALKAAAEYEQAAISLEVMIGSAKRAQKLMKDLLQFAAKTPLQFPDLLAAGKQLIAFGISADQVLPSLKALGNVSSALNLSIKDMAWLFGTTKTEGRLMGRDLRQFTMRGIPMTEELAKVLGVAQNEIKGLIAEAKVGWPHVQQAFKNMTEAGGRFHGLLERLSQSMGGLWTTMMDTFWIFLKDLGEAMSEVFGIKDMMRRIIGALQSARPEMVRLSMAVLKPLWGMLKAIGRIVVAALNLAVDMIVKLSGLLDKLVSGESWSKLFFGKKTTGAGAGLIPLSAAGGGMGLGGIAGGAQKTLAAFAAGAKNAIPGFDDLAKGTNALNDLLGTITKGALRWTAKWGGFGLLGLAAHKILSTREAARQKRNEWFAQRGLERATAPIAAGITGDSIKRALTLIAKTGRLTSPRMVIGQVPTGKMPTARDSYVEQRQKLLKESLSLAAVKLKPLTKVQIFANAVKDLVGKGGAFSEFATALGALRDALMNAPADFESSLEDIGKIVLDALDLGTKDAVRATVRAQALGVPAMEYGTAAAQRAIMHSRMVTPKPKALGALGGPPPRGFRARFRIAPGLIAGKELHKAVQAVRDKLTLLYREAQRQTKLAIEARVNSQLPIIIN